MRRIWFFSALLLLLGSSYSASAQSNGSVSLEAVLGRGQGWTDAKGLGGDYAVFADALIGLGIGSWFVAATAGIQGGGDYKTICILRPDGSCLPPHPDAKELALVVGVETMNRSARLLAGPTYATEGTLGLQVRADAFLPVDWRLSPMTGARYSVLPGFNGGTLHLLKIGLGIRIR
jgi:hypothetical protein